MEWMDAEAPAEPELVVENATGAERTIAVGCRTEQGVAFTESEAFGARQARRWSDLPDEPFEVGVSVDDGPEAGETFHPAETSGDITAVVDRTGVAFEAERAEPSGGTTDRQTGSDALAADEIYCRSCGDPIKRKAEICPECGVPNAARGTAGPGGVEPAAAAETAAGTGATDGQGAATDRQSRSEPSGRWAMGVRFGAVLWFAVALILLALLVLIPSDPMAAGGAQVGALSRAAGLAALLTPIQLLAWAVLPLSLYLDLRYVGYHTDDWPLHGRLYIAAAAVLPVFTQILGAASLFMRDGQGVVALVVPLLLLGLSVRHLRARRRLI